MLPVSTTSHTCQSTRHHTGGRVAQLWCFPCLSLSCFLRDKRPPTQVVPSIPTLVPVLPSPCEAWMVAPYPRPRATPSMDCSLSQGATESMDGASVSPSLEATQSVNCGSILPKAKMVYDYADLLDDCIVSKLILGSNCVDLWTDLPCLSLYHPCLFQQPLSYAFQEFFLKKLLSKFFAEISPTKLACSLLPLTFSPKQVPPQQRPLCKGDLAPLAPRPSSFWPLLFCEWGWVVQPSAPPTPAPTQLQHSFMLSDCPP